MKIKLTDNRFGKVYELEYTRNSVRSMEGMGFSLSEIQKKPVTMVPLLFKGAFIAHHKFVNEEVVNSLFDSVSDKDKLYSTLIEMYKEPMEALFNDETGDEAKNVTWEQE